MPTLRAVQPPAEGEGVAVVLIRVNGHPCELRVYELGMGRPAPDAFRVPGGGWATFRAL